MPETKPLDSMVSSVSPYFCWRQSGQNVSVAVIKATFCPKGRRFVLRPTESGVKQLVQETLSTKRGGDSLVGSSDQSVTDRLSQHGSDAEQGKGGSGVSNNAGSKPWVRRRALIIDSKGNRRY